MIPIWGKSFLKPCIYAVFVAAEENAEERTNCYSGLISRTLKVKTGNTVLILTFLFYPIAMSFITHNSNDKNNKNI